MKKKQVPWNKGLTKKVDSRIKTPKTCFKKGIIPWNKGHKRKFIFCKDCGKYKEHTARQLCSPCYRRWRETIGNEVKCKVCGRLRPHISKGMCKSCYTTWHDKNIPILVICKICGKLKNHESRGMCESCYKKNRPKRICKNCGKLKPITSKGRCMVCYNTWYFSTKKGKLAKNRFNKSDKCKIYSKKYGQSERGKEVRRKSERSPKSKMRYKRYHDSEKYKITIKKYNKKKRELENKRRKKFGLPLIGKGWISQAELTYKIKRLFPNRNVNSNEKVLNGNNGLELDIYIPILKLAFEYQGHQHYTFPSFFHKTIKSFKRQQERDRKTKELCNQKGITLIEFYEYEQPITEQKILVRLKKYGIKTNQLEM